MTIELGFTNDSLEKCEHALCRDYRRRIVGFSYIPPEDSPDELMPYRRQRTQADRLVDSILRGKEGRGTPEKVLFRGLRRGLAGKWKKLIADEDQISAWQELSPEKTRRLCRACTVPPLGEENCYDICFSSYPGIVEFKKGMLLTLHWLGDSTRHPVSNDIEALQEMVLELQRLCRGTRVSYVAEGLVALIGSLEADGMSESFWPQINGTAISARRLDPPVESSDESKKPGPEPRLGKSDIQRGAQSGRPGAVPFVDEFVSEFVYDRGPDTPYTTEEIRLALPLLSALAEAACRAAGDPPGLDCSDRKEELTQLAHLLEIFRRKVQKLIAVLQTAERYDLEVAMHL